LAARDYSAWVPIQYDNTVITWETVASAIYRAAPTPVPMTAAALEVPRLVGADVGGGSQLTEDTHNGDKVTMYAYQFNGKDTLDEAQGEDSRADLLTANSNAWLDNYFLAYDRASLGVSSARSATETNYRPYDSVYYKLANSDSATGYTANDNLDVGALTYASASTVLGYLEGSQYWSPASTVAIAHGSLRAKLRNLVDDDHRPIFITAGGSNVEQDTLFGVPVLWSNGAIVTANFQESSAKGNPLLVFANRKFLVRGSRIEPQSRFIPASINTDALEDTVQHRAREGFVLTVAQSAAALSVTG
jgi:hypothetical protein